MNLDILLIFPPNNMEAILGKGKSFIKALEPLGILYLAAMAERNNYSVKVLDAFVEGIGINEILDRIGKLKSKAVGISSLTSDATVTIKLCQKIKERFPDIFLILGNVHPSIYPHYFIEQGGADIIVHGEGEYIIVKILDAIKNGGGFSGIKGITYREGNEIINTGLPELIMDLDDLPMPARHLVDMDRYQWPFYFFPPVWRNKPRFIRGMITSRGCPIGCVFCAVHAGRRPRFQSAKKMFGEFMELVTKYKADYIFFFDPLFIARHDRLIEFSEMLIKNKVNIPWSCEAHINYINKDILKLIKRAGCISLSYGIESGVQQLLDNVGKKTKIENIEQAVRWTNEAGIEPVGLFMLGLPGETYDLSLKTIEFAKKLPIKHAQFSITTPYPGTALYNQLVGENKIDPYDWDRYSAYAAFSDKDTIWTPDGMTSEQLKKLQKYAIRSFFLRPAHLLHLLKKIKLSHIKDVLSSLRAIS